MSKTCFLLGGDERQRWAAQALLDRRARVRCCSVPRHALRRSRSRRLCHSPGEERLRGTAAPGVPPCSPAAATGRAGLGGLAPLQQALLDFGAGLSAARSR